MSATTDSSAPLRSGIQINIPRPVVPPPMPAPIAAEPAQSGVVPDDLGVVPPMPESLEDTGISLALIEQLILKFLYFRGEVMGRDLASLLGLQYSLIDDLLETLKRQHYVGIRKSLGMGNSSGIFALTESGRNLTREYLESNQYTGTIPVPLHQYAEVVRRQRLAENWLSPASLHRAFKHLVVEQDILARIGPAVNSNKSFLIYGQPGNGKTALAESLFRVETAPIYLPYAIECQGNIVQLYDPIYHQKLDDDTYDSVAIDRDHGYDRRWFKCRRPFIITGGELSLDMLDLSFNKVSKVYDAPFQLKANNGIYLIDDFGRQKASPAEILNRWIVPMERHVDYLSFQAGGKMTVPFEAFLIFSTNLRPDQLGDEAFLRRIQYKMFLRSPGKNEFVEIFERFTDSRMLDCAPGVIETFVNKHYVDGGKRYRRCHPRDVISHAIDIINFESLPKQLTEDVLDRAFDSCFTDNIDVND
ncbi:MAG: ATP-binding protein [Acidobacteriia bacterium]|nr:ATP-binding protein [Terriglobia bacterium]